MVNFFPNYTIIKEPSNTPHCIISWHYYHLSKLTGDNLHQRIRLDCRRFENAHLKYAVLSIHNHYPGIASGLIPVHTDIASTLESFTPLFYEAFSQRYSGTLRVYIYIGAITDIIGCTYIIIDVGLPSVT